MGGKGSVEQPPFRPHLPPCQIFNLIPRYFMNVPSRPLWYTVDQAPVLILGGIPEEKSVLLTDTSFKDSFLVEVSRAEPVVGNLGLPGGGCASASKIRWYLGLWKDSL